VFIEKKLSTYNDYTYLDFAGPFIKPTLMSTNPLSDRFPGPVDPRLHARLQLPQASDRDQLTEFIYDLLMQAATTEHLLSMQYLFASFSMKKYPEEFADYQPGSASPPQQAIN
jgi:hypothetical protein